eukprot:TRINITY_DN1057_c0_g1_i3.p1 TRINITY_DN1057_c0_g1~~TRINITY_DN1057_c0_g1_i3.p1  ORF type:complete len:500 (-),score=131.73 TRINITY_DN1057_c0_g1_i3:73-1572(-)
MSDDQGLAQAIAESVGISSGKDQKKQTTTGRIAPSVQYPETEFLDSDVLFANDCIDLAVLQKHLLNEGRLSEDDVFTIARNANQIFANEPTLLTVDAPVTVVGDIHGQYYDLVKMFELGGPIQKTTYLFLGDYVDRGYFSMEVLLHLFSLKILYPKTIYMIRGNHECRHLSEYFTFKEECLHKYGEDVYEVVLECFNSLPLGAIVNNQFLCIHGGISPEIKFLDDIRKIDRFREPPSTGPMCDLLWADPAEDFTPSNDDTFEFNEVRGCSYTFTYKAACQFLERNKLLSIIRAHEAQDDGYKMYPHRESTGFPTVITIFSAPNYLDLYNNKAAVLRYEKNVLNIRQYNQSPHPYWLPDFMDVFTWSLPFVAEKVAEMLLVLFKLCDDKDGEDDGLFAQETDKETQKRRQALREKIRAASRFMRMFSTLRKERETIVQIKAYTASKTIPRGLLSGGPEALKEALTNFKAVKNLDKPNEKRPPPQAAAFAVLKKKKSESKI